MPLTPSSARKPIHTRDVACNSFRRDASPFPATCPAAADNYQRLVGVKFGEGFSKQVRDLFGGTSGCAHQNELLRALCAIAIRTYYSHVIKSGGSGSDMAGKDEFESPLSLLNSCHAYASASPVVAKMWPEQYTGVPPSA